MKRMQSGFTLIELVVVIVILGILAATAIPRFVDLSTEAADAAVQGVAGGLGSGSAINYATCKANSAHADCQAIANCTDVSATLQGGLPAGYTITAAAIAADAAVTCTVTKDDEGSTATFTGLGT